MDYDFTPDEYDNYVAPVSEEDQATIDYFDQVYEDRIELEHSQSN